MNKNILSKLSFAASQCCLLMCVLVISSPALLHAGESTLVPRTVLAFYDSELDGDISKTEIHETAEMPLNHLGLVVRYQDIQKPLPDKNTMSDIRGILFWPYWDSMPNPNAFLHWMIAQMQAGQRVVIMGSHAFEAARMKSETAVDTKLVDQFWQVFGLSRSGDWVSITYDIKLTATVPEMTGFERSMNPLPSFPIKVVQDKSFTSQLSAHRAGSNKVIADLVLTGPRGGYVAPDYSLIYLKNGMRRYWFINPFRFFREAFATDDLPKADTTTLSGRRIYYSHVDGDGWRSLTLVPGYREKKKTVTEVLLHEVFEKYPDLPVTVAPVAADIDADWFGTKEYQRLAKKIFSLPHVEAGSHTFSHPLDWTFFENYTAEKEAPYLDAYPKATGRPDLQNLLGYNKATKNVTPESKLASQAKTKQKGQAEKAKTKSEKLNNDFDIPRAFYTGEFNIDHEVQGSVDVIKSYLPQGKRVELLQWSGDTRPFAEVLKQTRRAGLRNLNGGDTRLDRDFDSYVWVSSIGREVGSETGRQRQIYSSSSNENTYTNLWKNHFYGYAYLEQTLRRTETPWRIKPINIYYHNYSGERLASLNALHKNFAYAQSQRIAPIAASRFAAIGDGFFTTVFERLGERQWRVKNRDQLQTIRFDNATFDAVDFSHSKGVIGQSHLHGSLYVQLDSAHDEPVIALRKINYGDREPEAMQPYLIGARWSVSNVVLMENSFHFQVQGFGAGDMDWYVPEPGQYRVHVEKSDGTIRTWETTVDDEHWLNILLDDAPIKPSVVKVEAVQVKHEGA
jgi:hypothetical protein